MIWVAISPVCLYSISAEKKNKKCCLSYIIVNSSSQCLFRDATLLCVYIGHICCVQLWFTTETGDTQNWVHIYILQITTTDFLEPHTCFSGMMHVSLTFLFTQHIKKQINTTRKPKPKNNVHKHKVRRGNARWASAGIFFRSLWYEQRIHHCLLRSYKHPQCLGGATPELGQRQWHEPSALTASCL